MARVALGYQRVGPRLLLDGRPELCPGLATPSGRVPVPPDGVSDVLAGTRVTVRRRLRTGFDDDGNPEYAWGDMLSGPVLGTETRRETEPVSGQTRWTATVTVLYSGPGLEDTTCEVVDGDGRRWAVTGLAQLPDRLTLTMTRLDIPSTVEVQQP